MLAEAREDVLKADQKASMVLAALGIAIGAVLGGVLAGDWDPTEDLTTGGQVGWWLATAAVTSGLVLAGMAVWPRFNGADGSAGIYYWAHIASFDSLSALAAALDADPPDLDDRTRNQMWSLARIVKRKYVLIRWAMGSAGAGAFLATATLVIDGLAR
jgi:hypothetical protein